MLTAPLPPIAPASKARPPGPRLTATCPAPGRPPQLRPVPGSKSGRRFETAKPTRTTVRPGFKLKLGDKPKPPMEMAT